MSGVQILEVAEDADGQRLDRWLRQIFPHVTQGRIEKMCRKGELRIDGARAKANTRVGVGQAIRIPPLPEQAAPEKKRQVISEDDAQMIQDCVIFKDDDVLALNKPPGLPTQGGSKQTRHVDGLAEALKFGLPTKPKLVHRLDKDTSGVLLLARNTKTAAALTRAFQAKTTRKIYWAAVAGVPQPRDGLIEMGLVKQSGHGPNGAGEKMVAIHPRYVSETEGAKHAASEYRVLDAVAQRTAFVALQPITGRTHQLRAHMAAIGHPIVGDGKYGTNAQENLGDGWGAQLGGDVSRKLHLHARMIRFAHPTMGHKVTITAPLSRHMVETWDLFQWDQVAVDADPFEETP
ncbi:MAG: RluA family pseudouridine synthase [Pseudomonadota bacterium]